MCSCIAFTSFDSRSAFKVDHVVVGLVLSFSFFLSGLLWVPGSWAGADWMSWAEKADPGDRYVSSEESCWVLLSEMRGGTNTEKVLFENDEVPSLGRLIFGESRGVFLVNNFRDALIYDHDRPVVEMMFSAILDGLMDYKTRLVDDTSKLIDGEGNVIDRNQVFEEITQGIAKEIFRGLMQIYLSQPMKEMHLWEDHQFGYFDRRGGAVAAGQTEMASDWMGTILNHLQRLPILTQARMGEGEGWTGSVDLSPLDRVIARMVNLKTRYVYVLQEKKARSQLPWHKKLVGFFQSPSPSRELLKVRLKMIKFILHGKPLDLLEDGD